MPHRLRLVERTLANGLRVVIASEPSTPVVAVNVAYRVGSGHERPGRTGFAHLFEHMMFQGSSNVGKGEHFARVQAAGGRANAYTSWDFTVFHQTLPSHRLDLALWLEADRMGSLVAALSQGTLDNQREVVKNERRLRVDNQPYGTAEERLMALAFPPGHPYHHAAFGSMADLDAASLEDVVEFFASWYVPNNAVLVIAGDVDVAPAMASVERYFGLIAGRELPPLPIPAPLAPTSAARQVEVLESVPAGRALMGFPIAPFGTARFSAAEVAADLLARGRGSRLYGELVRRRRVATEVSAAALRLVAGNALLVIDVMGRADADPEQLAAACLEAFTVLGADGAGPSELERVRALREVEHARLLERAADRGDLIGMHACLVGRPERADQELAAYLRVTSDEARTAARSIANAGAAVVLFRRAS